MLVERIVAWSCSYTCRVIFLSSTIEFVPEYELNCKRVLGFCAELELVSMENPRLESISI